MLSRGARTFCIVGIALVALGLVTHIVFKLYGAPAAAEFELLTQFVATFASVILTFFIGALLYDHQVEQADARRDKRLRSLLAAELEEVSESLDLANAFELHLPDGSSAEVVLTHLQPTVIEEAIKEGFFDPSRVREALRLARHMRSYNARVSYLVSFLNGGATREPDAGQRALRVVKAVEGLRQNVVAEAESLAAREQKYKL